METIFEHNPTQVEIEQFTNGFSKEYYLSKDKDILIADIAIMYADRGNTKKSNEYWSKIPDLHQQWQLGLDYVTVAVD